MQRGFYCSESAVLFHLVSWMAFLGGVLSLFCLFWGVLVLLFEDIRLLAFHLFSYKLRIVDRLQNVDDRQSLECARHGLKKSGYFLRLGITLRRTEGPKHYIPLGCQITDTLVLSLLHCL